ncbi:MAG: 50S ribosomal protein L4 [Clostridia bacterium]|nr:50S ribosomal protein L4 [Oscillospiraceae bacterium]MBR4893485.1 50S ribosomal protein L4 [Clostridia bacterium]
MPKVDLYNMEGKVIGDIELSDKVFGVEINNNAMHAVVVNHLANSRQGTQSTKTRTEVRGGGIKPWKQKGTGRARQGSIRAPQWTGGGVALGPKPRSYRYSLNKKLRQVALKSALSSKVIDNNIIVVDNIAVAEYKTKEMVKMLANLKVDKKALIVLNEKNDFVVKSANNIPDVKTTLSTSLNTYDVLNCEQFVITLDAVKKLEEVYA